MAAGPRIYSILPSLSLRVSHQSAVSQIDAGLRPSSDQPGCRKTNRSSVPMTGLVLFSPAAARSSSALAKFDSVLQGHSTHSFTLPSGHEIIDLSGSSD